MPESFASTSRQLPDLNPPMVSSSSPTQIRGTKAHTCKHRPHTDAHSRPRCSHVLTCIHDPTQALVVYTEYKLENMPARTCTHGHTPTYTHTAQNNPRQGLYQPRALMLTKLTS